MKETKTFLRNQNDIYLTMLANHVKEGKWNDIYIRDMCNMRIANHITIKGIETAHPTKKKTTKNK